MIPRKTLTSSFAVIFLSLITLFLKYSKILAVYDNGTLWCRARREECTDGVYWVNSYHNVIHDVVMWAKVEIPTFKE